MSSTPDSPAPPEPSAGPVVGHDGEVDLLGLFGALPKFYLPDQYFRMTPTTTP